MNEVKDGEPYISDLGFGGVKAGHIWAEPKNDKASAFYLDANSEKAFQIDDMSSVFHYELVNDIGEGKDDLRLEDLNGILNEDEIANLPSISLTNGSEDYVLDVDFFKKVPEFDYHFCEELSLGRINSEIQSAVTSGEVNGTSELSRPVLKCLDDQFGKTTCGGEQHVSEHKGQNEKMVEDEMARKCSLTCELNNVHQRNEVQSTIEIGCSFNCSIDNICLSLASTKASCSSSCKKDDDVYGLSEGTGKVDVSSGDLSSDCSSEDKMSVGRQRRSRKPPQRFVEGSAWLASRHHKTRKSTGGTSKDKDLRVLSQRKHNRKAKAPNTLEVYSVWELDPDDEYEPLSSKSPTKKSRKRSYGKKANNLWTVDEVILLVDGLTQYGLGQWTAVKRNCFKSSNRTATDIRDKWRNLVKSNCRDLKCKRKDDQHQRSGIQLLPESLIERVRELANSHPVPRGKSNSGKRRNEVLV